MRYVISSIFRNSGSYLDRYIGQVTNLVADLFLRDATQVHLLLVEGDSTDTTWQDLPLQIILLRRQLKPKYLDRLSFDISKKDHGGRLYGSIESDDRWRNISAVCNHLLDRVPEDADRLIYVESDLLWQPQTMLNLTTHLDHGFDAIAPMCFHLPTGAFYDTWGHRKDGVRFSPHIPHHAALAANTEPLVAIDSAGSCIVMSGAVARTARFVPPEHGIVGFCNDIRAKGFRLMLDPRERVLHP